MRAHFKSLRKRLKYIAELSILPVCFILLGANSYVRGYVGMHELGAVFLQGWQQSVGLHSIWGFPQN